MSIMRAVAVFLLSALFTFSLFMAVTSYTLGDLLQKENLKGFIETGIAPDVIDSQCNSFCAQAGNQTELCLEMCRTEIGNQTGQTIDSVIDDVYGKEFYGVSIEQITSFLNMFVLFVILTAASGVSIVFLSKEPLSTMGRNMISVAITLLITALAPNFVLSMSNIPFEGVFSDYMSRGLEQQMIFAIVLIVVAIVMLVAEYMTKRKKK